METYGTLQEQNVREKKIIYCLYAKVVQIKVYEMEANSVWSAVKKIMCRSWMTSFVDYLNLGLSKICSY